MLALIGACTAPARPARALAPALLINEFMPRPGTGGEWAELINLGDTDLDLAGWAIDDDTIGGTRTLIAAGTSAPAHGLLLVALTANILNDTGTDAIQLSDPAGTLVDSFAYSSASAGQSYARMPDGGPSWLKGAPSPGAWNSSATPTMPVTPSSAPAATNTPSPTATTSPTYTPTATNTATASATATPYLPGILLNEFVAYPKTLYTNEWVELYNSGDILVDLSGWKIDDSEGGQSPYALPPGSLLAAGGYLVVELPSAILNNDGDSLRLLHPDGSLADATSYSAASADLSRSRADDQSWYESAINTPGEPNLPPATATPTTPPTATRTSTPTTPPTATRTSTPTTPPTATRTSTPTTPPTATRTSTPTTPPTTTRTSTPSATPAVWPNGILINELLPNPQARYGDEWVELFNGGTSSADLAGWQIDDGVGGGAPHTLPAGSLLAPGAYLVVALPNPILNNDGDSVRLLRPDGSLADTVDFAGSAADQSYNRAADNSWYQGDLPSPGAANLPPSRPGGTPSPATPAAPGRTPTPVPSGTRVAAGTGTANTVQLSELLPFPKTLYTSEWVELYNSGDSAIDLGGWAIDDGVSGGAPYRLPPGTTIAPHALLVVTLPRPLLNNSTDSVRLLGPDGQVLDQGTYTGGAPDLSFCRAGQAWARCAASPGGPNPPPATPGPAATATPQPSAAVPVGLATRPAAPPARPNPIARPARAGGPTASAHAAQPYALPQLGTRYRGVAPAPTTTMPARAPAGGTATPTAAEQPGAATPAKPALTPVGTGVALLLVAIGGAALGYQQIGGVRAPPGTAPDASGASWRED
jgi:hypothetical protein